MLPAALLLAVLHAAETPKLVMPELTTAGAVDRATATVVSDAIATEVAGRGFFSPVTAKDMQTLIGLERQRQLVGCSEDQSQCLTELAGALGAANVLSGSLGRLGDAYQLNLQMLDAQRAQVVGRSTRIARTLEELRAQLPWAVAEATGTPLPPPPSRVLPYSLIGAGALAVVVGGVLETFAFTRQSELSRELDDGTARLRERAYYEQRLSEIRSQQLLGLVALGAGAALIGAGVALNPAEVAASGSVKVALVPGPSGAALVGVFP